MTTDNRTSEEQIERAALAAINYDRDDYGFPPVRRLLELGREEAHRRIESMRAAFTAAGVAPQGPQCEVRHPAHGERCKLPASHLTAHDTAPQEPSEERAMSGDKQRKVRLDHLLGVFAVGSGDWSWQEEYEQMYAHYYQHELTEQIRANGITEPVLLGSDGRVWDGHHRICAAMHIGISEVPVEFSGEETRNE